MISLHAAAPPPWLKSREQPASGTRLVERIRKWNKIEHRLFSQITQNWRGRPLVSRETVVALIRSTSTTTGLRVRARLDTRKYPIAKPVPDGAVKRVSIRRHRFHGDWNYTVRPAPRER